MQELRRVRSGQMTEDEGLVTLHDLMDAQHIYQSENDERALREVIQPLESLLVGYKRLVLKDTAVSAICHGAKLTLPGLLKFGKHLYVLGISS